MKKRSKLIASLVASMLCLGLIVYGVYALTVSFALNSSFSFESTGVYVGVSGQVYTGSSKEDVTPLNEEGKHYTLAETKNFTQKDDGTPDGSRAEVAIAAWEPENVELDVEVSVLVYEVTFKNYSPHAISVTVDNTTPAVDGVSMTENAADVASIPKDGTEKYTLTIEITNFLYSIEQKPVKINFSLKKLDMDELNAAFFLFDETTGQITGMNTETYTAETAPETLTIPLAIKGTEVKSLKVGTYSKPTFVLENNTKNFVIEAAVDSIPEYCFYKSTSLTSITLPEGVTSIGGCAFDGCTSLTSITIPEGVTSIGNSAFYSCKSLVSIDIPSSVIEIEYSAFQDCSSLVSIVIPKGVTVLNNRILYGCTSLESISIPEGVTEICDHAIRDCVALVSITIPYGVESLGKSAFQGCTSLSSISLPSSLKSIESQAILSDIPFVQNLATDENGLKIVSSSDDSNYKILIGSDSSVSNVDITEEMLEGVKVLNSHAFGQYDSPRSVEIPDGVERIPSNMFQSCSNLTSVSIPSSVTNIGPFAFTGCTSLASITIPSSVISMGNYAFDGCSSLMITVDEENANYSSLGGSLYNKDKTELIRGAAKTVVDDIPSSVTRISSFAFSGCTSLTSITIPSSVTSIEYQAFSGCTSLTSITIPSSVTNIGSQVFNNCTSLVAATIDSQNVVSKLTSSSGAGDLLSNSSLKTVYIKSGLNETKATYLASNFTKQSSSDKTGYYMWTR